MTRTKTRRDARCSSRHRGDSSRQRRHREQAGRVMKQSEDTARILSIVSREILYVFYVCFHFFIFFSPRQLICQKSTHHVPVHYDVTVRVIVFFRGANSPYETSFIYEYELECLQSERVGTRFRRNPRAPTRSTWVFRASSAAVKKTKKPKT